MRPSSICPTWVFFAGTTAPCRPNGARQQLATAKVTRMQYEDWRKAKNRALRSFLKDKTRDSELVTITAPGFVHGHRSWTPGFSGVMLRQKTERTTGLSLRLPPSSSTGSSEPAIRRLGPSLCFRLGQGSWLSVLAVRSSQSRIPKCRLVAVDALTGSNPAIQDEDLVPSEGRFRHDGTKATRFYEPDGDRPPAGRALASAHQNPHGWTSTLRVVRDALVQWRGPS